MGKKKQDSVSDANITSFFTPPSAAISNSIVQSHAQPESEEYHQEHNQHLNSEVAMPPVETQTPPGLPDGLAGLAGALQPQILNITERSIHPFFNKEARIAIQLKSKPNSKPDKQALITQKILSNENGGRVTKTRKRPRKRKELAMPGTALEDGIQNGSNSDGDFPSPSSTDGSDYESGIDDLSNQRVNKRRKDIGELDSIPTPPRSSENDGPEAPNALPTYPLSRTLPSATNLINGSESALAVWPATTPQPGAINHLAVNSITSTEPSKTLGTATRSAFDLMKQSSTSMAKTRSRSMSPPAAGAEEPPLKKAKTRGRPRKSAPGTIELTVASPGESSIVPAKLSLIVKLKIGKDAAARLELPPPEPKSLIVKLKIDKNKLEQLRPKPHPFFMKASEKRELAAAEKITIKTANDSKPILPKPPTNSFIFQKEAKPKFKVELLPAWPTRDNSHVRNLRLEDTTAGPPSHNIRSIAFSKGKVKSSTITPRESALDILQTRYVNIRESYCYKGDENGRPVPPPTVRIPNRCVLGASQVIDYIITQLQASTRLFSENTHPAIRHLVDQVKNGELLLTAFDNGGCETQSWTSLYAPTSSDCVIQTGQEAKELSKWLRCMKITSVDTGANLSKPKPQQVKKKKKPKHELDDFIVSEEEDHDSLDEITDPEDINVLLPGLSRSLKRSEIRQKSRSVVSSVGNSSGPRKAQADSPPPRLANAILISGPPGIGKTAAVYAAAREHGFVVFEINAGTKRGGKEIQEMVGDMSRNHLVHQAKSQEPSDAPEPETLTKPLSNALNSFFKKQGAKPKIEEQPQTEAAKEKEKVKQQQSLILIEEADILFDEDKGFWSSIISLIEKSRRPVVITCNDESSLPLADLALYAKLRFKPASPDLAADYLTVLLAAQGHLLNRTNLKQLYEKFNYDLRRTITHLNFWCQMGLGDRTWSGRWWYFETAADQKTDKTITGELKRSISRDTYLPEMNAFGRELLLGDNGRYLAAEQLDEVAVWKDVTDATGVDLGDRFYHEGLPKWMEAADGNRATLSAYSDYIDSLSALDCYSRFGTVPEDSLLEAIDPSPSSINDKNSLDNLLELRTVDAERKRDPLSITSMLSITTQILARKALHEASPRFMENCDKLFSCFEESEILNMISTNGQFRARFRMKTMDDLRYPFERLMSGHTQLIRPTSILTETIPYIREIARYDLQNEEEAKLMSSLISQRENVKKRKTRASMFASEGRSRGGRRPKTEQYFRGNLRDMINTGGDWDEAVELHTIRPPPDDEMDEETEESETNADSLQPTEIIDDTQDDQNTQDAQNNATRPLARRRIIDDDDDIEDGSSDT
ncbi:hypothetical protein ABW19_dt0207670 [Dactylella cylindrospora]|nr:hypothetical protein ABW19_dt0207670 [Dactylella cylindrospora]